MSEWSRDAAVRFAAYQKIKQVQDAKVIHDQNGGRVPAALPAELSRPSSFLHLWF